MEELTHFATVVEEAAPIPGQVVLYDKGADRRANRAVLKEQGLGDGIQRRKPKGKPMHWNRVRNRLISKRRFVVERTLGTLKGTYGLDRVRYLGLAKVHAETQLKSIAYNLKRAKGKQWQRLRSVRPA